MKITRLTIYRFALDALVISCVLFAPWFVTLAIALVGIIFFASWYDVAVIALLYDALYDPHPFAFVGLFGIALAVVMVSDIVREMVREKNDHKLHFK